MKYKFWVSSSRMTDISEEVDMPDYYTDDDLESEVYSWCEDVFPMFHFTDARVDYGYEKIE